MKPRKLPLKVEKLNIAFKSVDNREDSVYFRINFYSVTDSMPGNNILEKDIIVKHYITQGWNEFDLQPFNIIMKENFFVGIEWLPDLDKKDDRHIMYGAVMMRPQSAFGRDTRFGEWWKMPGFAISMNLQVLYY